MKKKAVNFRETRVEQIGVFGRRKTEGKIVITL